MTPTLTPASLVPGVGAWFTAADAGNLSHRRPHIPAELAAARRRVCEAIGTAGDRLHFMQQVHGAAIGRIDDHVALGAEIRDVDALVTSAPDRALVVQVADCVPVLLASTEGPIAAAHAGRRGVVAGVVTATVEAMGVDPASIHAALGPAIGGCCYEVPVELRDELGAAHPAAVATTTWGTPSLDLPAAVASTLDDVGVASIQPSPGCTRCTGQRWFSHRRDPAAGRQAGIVIRWAA